MEHRACRSRKRASPGTTYPLQRISLRSRGPGVHLLCECLDRAEQSEPC